MTLRVVTYRDGRQEAIGRRITGWMLRAAGWRRHRPIRLVLRDSALLWIWDVALRLCGIAVQKGA